MFRNMAALAIVLAAAGATPVLADCSTEVALAVNSQAKQKFIRKETHMISDRGPVKMVVEYQPPDRMRQVLTPMTEEKSVESIVVGEKAWTNNGDGWKEAPPREAEQLVQYMIKSIAQVYQEVGKFECLGTEMLDGQEVRAYRGIDEPPKAKPGEKAPPKNEAARIVYLDVKTGLPARSIFAREGFLDKPIFKEVYTYPDHIAIEAPKDVK